MFKYLALSIVLVFSSHTIAEDDFFKPRTEIKILQLDDQFLDKKLPINNDFLKSYDPNIKISNNVTYKLDLEKIEMKVFKDVDNLNKLKLLIPYDVRQGSHSIGRYALAVCPIRETKTTTTYDKAEEFEVDGSHLSGRKMNFDSITTRMIEPGYYLLSGKPKEKVIMTKLANRNISPFNNNPITTVFIILCQNIELELHEYEITQLKKRIEQQKKDTEMRKLGIKY